MWCLPDGQIGCYGEPIVWRRLSGRQLEFARLEALRVPAETIPQDAAPLLANVWRGRDADIRRLPVVRHFEMDLGPVLTMAVVMRDPDDGSCAGRPRGCGALTVTTASCRPKG